MARKARVDFQFIASPSNARNPHPPYYFLYLAAYLREKGFSVEIIDPKGGDRPKDIREHYQYIKRRMYFSPASFIGLAAFHSDYPQIMELGRFVQNEMNSEAKLLVGNCHATINPEDFIFPGSPFDYAIRGEGEKPLVQLARAQIDGSLERPQGIAYLNESGEMVVTGTPEVLDLKAYWMGPAYDLINMDYYTRPQKLIIRRLYTRMVCVFAGRGCPYNCDFCAANNVWKANKGKAARLRPVNDVLSEIYRLKKHYGVDFVYMFDDMFGMKKYWMVEWFNKYRSVKDGYAGLPPYACQTRADICTEEMVYGLKETGCIQLDIGVEAGDQWLLDKVNKKITLDQVRRVFSWCRKYKIRSFATMLLNLPGETIGSLERTYNFMEEIKPTAGIIFSVCTPYPGTAMYRELRPPLKPEEYGLLINNRLNPIDRFRLALHDLDFEKLWDQWNRHFLATPMFERMWALRPFQLEYWRAVLGSGKVPSYVWCWMKDLPKTFLLWWAHKLGLYRMLKRLQYGGKKWEGNRG